MLYPRKPLTRFTVLFLLGFFLSFAPFMPLLGTGAIATQTSDRPITR